MNSLLLAFSWQDITNASSNVVLQIIAWVLIGIGMAGTILPFVPGTLFVLAGGLVLRLGLGDESGLTWVTIGILTAFSALAFFVDWAASALGAKWFGASGWGVFGAVAGGILGALFFNIPGLIFGPFICAFALEVLMADRKLGAATQSTWGAFVGTVLGIILKGGLTIAMLAWILLDMFKWK